LANHRVVDPADEPTLEQMQAASLMAFHRWRARYPGMDLPEHASAIFLAGFAAGACHGVKLASEKL
jgi:hypothetical protein